jgi:hypothetical protein
MNAEDLRAMQLPLKERYRHAPEAALITLSARHLRCDSGADHRDHRARMHVHATPLQLP